MDVAPRSLAIMLGDDAVVKRCHKVCFYLLTARVCNAQEQTSFKLNVLGIIGDERFREIKNRTNVILNFLAWAAQLCLHNFAHKLFVNPCYIIYI